MKINFKKTIPIGCITFVMAMHSNSSSAQVSAQVIEEIVITAERRETTEQTTSISMEVLTGDNLAGRQIQNIEDLMNAMPNIQISQWHAAQGGNICEFLRSIQPKRPKGDSL